MKKFYKIAVLTFICLFIFANTSCSFFSAIGRIFINVSNGNATGDNSFILDAYLCEAGDDVVLDEHGHGPQIDHIKAKEIAAGEEKVISFENPVREGTIVKVFVYVKTKNAVGNGASAPHHYYSASSEAFAVQEGVNTPDISTWVGPVNSAWWY